MSFIRNIAVTSLLFLQLLFAHSTAFAICTDYQHYPDAEIEKYMSILEDPEQPEIRRTIAYDKIACSDDPIYRQYALKIGLKDSSASILRSKILMDAMMRKDIFVIDLIESPNLTKESKTYIKENNGQIRFQAYNRDPIQGCITIYISSKCGGNRQVKVTKKYVEITFIKFYGKFELTSNNDLEGYVISSRRSKTEKIPAKLSLF